MRAARRDNSRGSTRTIPGRVLSAGAGALFTLLIAAVVYVAIEATDEESADGTDEVSAVDGDSGTTLTTTGTSSSGPGSTAPRSTTLPDGPYVLATLAEDDFVLTGVVPNAELAESVNLVAELTYAPFGRSELTVDDQLPDAEWLAASPATVPLLATITNGTLLIADGQVTLSGQVPSQVVADQLASAITKASGLPVVTGAIEITNLQPPLLELTRLDGPLVLSGAVPNQDIRDRIATAAVDAYGAEEVDDQLQVDPNVHTTLWMYTIEPFLGATTAFPEFDVQLHGNALSGLVRGGYTFEPDSDQLTPTYEQVLQFGIGVLLRDQSLQLLVTAHTDDQGDDAYNLDLSQRRADAVAELYLDAGIDPKRVTAVGRGETEPIASNDTEEGRSRNRRIDVVLSSLPS